MDPMLTAIAKCGRSQANVCRNLHKLIHAKGRTLPVRLSTVLTPVQVLCGKPGVRDVNYPVLHLSSWAKLILQSGGEMLLGGFSLDEEVQFRSLLSNFWIKFQKVVPDLDLYSKGWDLSTVIPIGLHGDEGRGKLKRPILILAHQPIISHLGVDYTNLSGYPACLVVALVDFVL